MNEILVVDVSVEKNIKCIKIILIANLENSLNSSNHLIRQHKDSLHCESSGAKDEEILETWSEEIHDEDVVVPLLAVPPDVRDTHTALEDLVQLALIQQLRMASLDALKLYSHFLSIGDVDSEIDVSEAPRPDLPDQAVLATHDEL